MTTYGDTSDDKFVKLTIICFQCRSITAATPVKYERDLYYIPDISTNIEIFLTYKSGNGTLVTPTAGTLKWLSDSMIQYAQITVTLIKHVKLHDPRATRAMFQT